MRLVLSNVAASPPGAPSAVLEGFSLEVGAGEWVSLGGANGCGKTSLLLVAAGLREPLRGVRRLEPDGPARSAPEPSATRPSRDVPRVATVLQDPSAQLLQATVADEIAMTAINLGEPPSEIESAVRRLAECFGLLDELGRDPRTLSAGQQQLVLMASALAASPDFLIADEPGAHLDSRAREGVLGLVRAEARRGMGVLWATQSPAEAAAADRHVEIGEESAATVAQAAPRPPAGSPAMTLRVRPPVGDLGPRVRTSSGIEVLVADRGVTALTGPNGAGKSVLLSIAAGTLDSPQVEKESNLVGPPLLVAQYPERQIFEETVLREVRYAALQRGREAGQAVEEADRNFRELGMPAGFLDRRTWELSAGERRLVLLVAALVAPAPLLALDEPTAGLDRARRAALAGIVARRGERTPILVASQDRGWLADLGARVLSIDGV